MSTHKQLQETNLYSHFLTNKTFPSLDRISWTVQSILLFQPILTCLNPGRTKKKGRFMWSQKEHRMPFSRVFYSPWQVHVCFLLEEALFMSSFEKEMGPIFLFLPCATFLNEISPVQPYSELLHTPYHHISGRFARGCFYSWGVESWAQTVSKLVQQTDYTTAVVLVAGCFSKLLTSNHGHDFFPWSPGTTESNIAEMEAYECH